MSGDQRARARRLAAVITAERARLAAVVAEAEDARADFGAQPPSLRELRGTGAILHDFYTGLERILERVAAELEGGLPAGSGWHRRLLEAAALDLPGVRPPVLSASSAVDLDEFLRFRHLFRNLYGFELQWPRLLPLLSRVPAVWRSVERDLDRFLRFLDAAASDQVE
jgi:hypothetical protein